MKKLLSILFIFCLSLSIALPVFARVAGQVILPERTTAPKATANTNKIYNLSNVATIVDENGNRYVIAGTGSTEFNSGISVAYIIQTVTPTAVDIDVTEGGAYHATAQTIFKVDLATYTGKTLSFSTEVTGTTIWFVDAVSVKTYGGASGVCIYNNVDPDFNISINFRTGDSGFVVAQDGSATYEAIP